MKLIVGLGNPGSKYEQTRHNIGSMALDRLAAELGCSFDRARFDAQTAEARIGDEQVLLLKPVTFMNLSGRSVGPAVSFFKLTPSDVMVVHDELDLPPGAVRFKLGGGSAGHNGLKSVTQYVGADYVRLRLGIGKAPPGWDTAVYVLGRFGADERPIVEGQLDLAVEGIRMWVEQGLQPAMNEIHRRQKESR